ncbi:hypothetical protein GGR56DRAFT_674543 [Xylariaceae sp. FL0804]|nr:hypothetical protein GGR56DRAFT_674543 [Xylariaceae sp. FL0804]
MSSSKSAPSRPPSSSSPSPYQSPFRAAPDASPLQRLACWARLRKYQIEVTYGVYVYTPAERAVFWALFALLAVAAAGVALLAAREGPARLAECLLPLLLAGAGAGAGAGDDAQGGGQQQQQQQQQVASPRAGLGAAANSQVA